MQLLVSMHETGEVSMFYHTLVRSVLFYLRYREHENSFCIVISVVLSATTHDLYLLGRTRIIHSAKIIQICQIIVDKIEILLLGMQETGLSRSIFQG